MKTVKFYDIPALLKNNDIRLEFDGDKEDTRLHAENYYRFGAKYKKDYTKACKILDEKEFKGNGWIIYFSYDVSSFEYWMKNMQEQVSIGITISFNTDEIEETELPQIVKYLYDAQEFAEDFENTYNYNPSPYSETHS